MTGDGRTAMGQPQSGDRHTFVLAIDVLYQQFGLTTQHMADEAIRLARERQT